jgi:hypothetical protein
MIISGEFFYYLFEIFIKKHRRGKMMLHQNSQVKGPKLDSTLERLLHHRRGNFLVQNIFTRNFSASYDSYKIFQEESLRFIDRVLLYL